MANIITAGNSTNGGTAITTDTSGTLNIVTGSGSGTTAITVDGSQNVGIGTSSPAFPLDVAGAIRGNSWIGRANTSVPSADAAIYRPADNTLGFSTANTERMRIDSSGNLSFNSGYGSVATAYGCRAWVNFNGTGVVAIRASGNVTSITDNGTGDYTVNFTTAMPDANYNASGSASNVSGGTLICPVSAATMLTSSLRIYSVNTVGSVVDSDAVSVAIFR